MSDDQTGALSFSRRRKFTCIEMLSKLVEASRVPCSLHVHVHFLFFLLSHLTAQSKCT